MAHYIITFVIFLLLQSNNAFSQAHLIQKTQYKWEILPLDWKNELRWKYEYNQEGEKVKELKEIWSEPDQEWLLEEEKTYEYDRLGNVTSFQHTEIENNSFFERPPKIKKTIWNYNQQGQLVLLRNQSWQHSLESWIDLDIEEWFYDDTGYLKEKRTTDLSFDIQRIEIISEYYFRNISYQLDSIVSEKFKARSLEWQPFEKTSYLYSVAQEGDIKTTFYKWNPFYEKWHFLKEDVEQHNEEGQLISFSTTKNQYGEEAYGTLNYNADGYLLNFSAWSKAYETTDFRLSHQEFYTYLEGNKWIEKQVMENRFGLTYTSKFQNEYDNNKHLIKSNYDYSSESDLGIRTDEHTVYYENYCDGLPKIEILDQPQTTFKNEKKIKLEYVYDRGVNCPTSSEKFQLAIFPNPTNGILNIESEMLSYGPTHLELINNLGRIVWQSIFTDRALEYQINLTQFPEGNYFLKIWNEQQEVNEKIIIKN